MNLLSPALATVRLRGLVVMALSLCTAMRIAAAQPSAAPTRTLPADAARVRAEIASIESALPQIADRGAALFYLAKRYSHLGDRAKTLALLTECLSLHEAFDPSDEPAFQSLRESSEFRALADRARAENPRVHRARVAYTIAQSDLFPEGLAHDDVRHLFYMGSMHHRKIITITDAGAVSDFVQPERYGLKPVGGIKVDPADRSVWAATDGAEFVHFDTRGELLDRFTTTDEGSHILNDLVLAGTRAIYLTDSRANRVYRFDRQSHTFARLAFDRPLVLPNGIALSGDGRLLYVADLLGVIAVDLQTQAQHDVEPGPGHTLAGIDGLYWYRGTLVGVQYGTGDFRVIRAALSADGRRVTALETLERGTPLMRFPTTGVIVDGKFYFIANTGIGNLENDHVVDPRKLEPVHIAEIPLDSAFTPARPSVPRA